MANCTEHYGLHQWEPGDSFLRTDFNEDFWKIDAALGRAENKAERALAGLEPVGYDLCNLMLQNYYEGKYTGYKRALLFDGFLDEASVASKSEGVGVLPGGALRLYAAGEGDRMQNYGRTSWVSPGRVSDGWTPTGRGRATGVKLWITTGTSGARFKITLTCGKNSAVVTDALTATTATERTYIFSAPLILEAGSACSLAMENTGTYAFEVYISATNGQLGYHLLCTPLDAPTGIVTAKAADTGAAAGKALAWVRHTGGSVGVRLNGAEMTRTGSKGARTLRGESCTETAFVLEEPVAQSVTAALTLDALGTASMTIHDYSVILL